MTRQGSAIPRSGTPREIRKIRVCLAKSYSPIITPSNPVTRVNVQLLTVGLGSGDASATWRIVATLRRTPGKMRAKEPRHESGLCGPRSSLLIRSLQLSFGSSAFCSIQHFEPSTSSTESFLTRSLPIASPKAPKSRFGLFFPSDA